VISLVLSRRALIVVKVGEKDAGYASYLQYLKTLTIGARVCCRSQAQSKGAHRRDGDALYREVHGKDSVSFIIVGASRNNNNNRAVLPVTCVGLDNLTLVVKGRAGVMRAILISVIRPGGVLNYSLLLNLQPSVNT